MISSGSIEDWVAGVLSGKAFEKFSDLVYGLRVEESVHCGLSEGSPLVAERSVYGCVRATGLGVESSDNVVVALLEMSVFGFTDREGVGSRSCGEELSQPGRGVFGELSSVLQYWSGRFALRVGSITRF